MMIPHSKPTIGVEEIKYSYMIQNIGAAIGIVQLMKLDYFIKRRRVTATLYKKEFDSKVTQPLESDGKKHVYN